MPVIWVLAELFLISPTCEELAYEFVDFATKCGSSAMLLHSAVHTQVRSLSQCLQLLLRQGACYL
jgi:hypothetical protein